MPKKSRTVSESGTAPASAQPRRCWSFDDLKLSYNFRHKSNQTEVFLDLLAEEVARHRRPVCALEIGCGRGMALDPWKTRRAAALFDELWGVEPDSRVEPAQGAFTHFQHATLEEADLPESHFDLAYSRMVMEHVEEPSAFLRAAHRVLKPGGTYLFLTVNGSHYFARIARLLTAMRLDDLVLGVILKGSAGYHYPVAYKCNTTADLMQLCEEAGFDAPEFVFIERRGPAPYLRGPLKPILYTMNRKRDIVRRPELLLELIGRVRKPVEPPHVVTTVGHDHAALRRKAMRGS